MKRLFDVRTLFLCLALAALIGMALPVAALAASAAVLAAPSLLDRLRANALGLGVGLGGPLALMAAFMVAGRTVPGLVVGKLRRAFEEAKTSTWWRDASKPHRARLLYAAAVFLEAEVPDAGQGQEIYDAFGVWANARARISGFPLGSAAQWAALARKGGDAIDLELDAEVEALAALTAATPPADPPAA